MGDQLQFILTIDRIEPETFLENRPTDIFFSLTNYSGAQTNGVVEAHLFMGAPQYLPTRNVAPWSVKLESGETGTGVLTLTPPAVGKNLKLVLFYYAAPNVVARTEMPVDVAARYAIALSNFKAKTLRGGDHDELQITMSVQPADSFAMVALQETNVFVSADEAARGVQKSFSPSLRVDKIDVAPGSGSRYTVNLSFVILNVDTQNILLTAVLNEISDVAAAIASAYVPGDTMTYLNARMHALHQSLLAGCNGLVAADKLFLTGYQLNEWTATIDSHSETKRYISPDKTPQFGCSNQFSDYDVTYTLQRQRQPLPSEFLPVYPHFKTLSPGQNAIFSTSPSVEGNIDPNVTWSMLGQPDVFGKIDANSGAYFAPSDSDWRTVVIIRALHKDGRRGSAFVRILPRQTASVQLLGRFT
jgi:hypothetical protein